MEVGHQPGADRGTGVDDQPDAVLLRQPRDVPADADPADVRRIGLDEVEGAPASQSRNSATPVRHSPPAMGRASPAQLRVAVRVVVTERLLEEQQIERLERMRQVERRRA